MTRDAGDEDVVDAGDAADAAAWLEHARDGDFAAAWHLSDRMRLRQGRPDWTRPRHLQSIWTGTPFAGRRTLIRCYHGLGDTIQFIRYAPLVRAAAREVIVWAQPALLPLLATVAGTDRLVALHDGTPDVRYDVDVEVMELPYAFRTTLDTIPAAVPYLHVEAAPLRAAEGRRVGLAWRGGGWNTPRSIPFAALTPLFDVPGVRWICLQADVGPAERHPALETPDVSTVERTARVIRALDLVITVDSMPAHLAGTLAVPVWTLLRADADWRWLRDRHDTPWYPTMRLFRQPREGEWTTVVDQVRHTLASNLQLPTSNQLPTPKNQRPG